MELSFTVIFISFKCSEEIIVVLLRVQWSCKGSPADYYLEEGMMSRICKASRDQSRVLADTSVQTITQTHTYNHMFTEKLQLHTGHYAHIRCTDTKQKRQVRQTVKVWYDEMKCQVDRKWWRIIGSTICVSNCGNITNGCPVAMVTVMMLCLTAWLQK